MFEKVGIAARKKTRDLNSALSKDFNKYLAEIVLNSDDSYKRLKSRNLISAESTNKIIIELNRKKRIVTVVDHAEGMNLDTMRIAFLGYGADTSGGNDAKGIRGLFGQGASDVLFAAALHGLKSEIISIVDDKVYKAKFRLDENTDREAEFIQINQSKNRMLEMRKTLGIYENGTSVTFGLPEDVALLNEVKIIESIKYFYMFDQIFRDPSLEVLFNDGKKVTKLFIDNNLEDELVNHDGYVTYDDYKLKYEIKLYNNYNKREKHIIVIDEHGTVYDNQMFGFSEKGPGIDNLTGYLKIEGLSKFLRENLNKKIGENILSDSRDGFKIKHQFTKNLKKEVYEPISLAISKLNEKESQKESLDNDRDTRSNLDKINRYFMSELDDEIGGISSGLQAPPEGLRFIRERATCTINKTYTIKVLVNTDVIPLGSVIEVVSDKQIGILSGSSLIVSENNILNENLAVLNIRFSSKELSEQPVQIIAKFNSVFTKLFVQIIDQENFNLTEVIEFERKSYKFRDNSAHIVRLYFDSTVIDKNSRVKLESGKNIRTSKSTSLLNSILETGNTFYKEIEFNTGDISDGNLLIITVGNYTATTSIDIVDKYSTLDGKSGLFSGIKQISREDAFWQSFWDKRTGYININVGHPINAKLLGNTIFNGQLKMTPSQKASYFDLVSYECARVYANISYEKGHLRHESFLDEIQKQKNILFQLIK
jgi:hypothetical protein